MDDSPGSSDSSDEEYIPPIDVNESSDESDDDLLDEDLQFASCKTQTQAPPLKDSDRDAIWNDFLNGDNDKKTSTKNSPANLKSQSSVTTTGSSTSQKEELVVTSKAVESSTSQKDKKVIESNISSIQPTSIAFPKTSTSSKIVSSLPASSRLSSGIPTKRPITDSTGINDRLGDALKRLKQASLPSTAPKLSTLEKSRLDWEDFTKKEDIVEDLKLHNKGKHGYIERKAFEIRASERQYQIEQEARLKASQRR